MPSELLSIPKAIHAVWLGKLPPTEVLDNMQHWKQTNPTFSVKLWIDSATYSEEEKTKELPKLLQWAKKNQIIICDLSLAAHESKDNLLGKNELYSSMPGKQFYDDELTGQYRNLAAASDLLRVEILQEEGGIYIDAKDMLPGNPILEHFKLSYGFAYHDCGYGKLNNDLMASIPHGTIISEYRKQIIENYKNLYQNPQLLQAHRNKNLRSPKFYTGADPRFISTLRTSGPGLLSALIEQLMHFVVPIPEAKMPIYDVNESFLHMPKELFNIPEHGSDVSWNDFNLSYDMIKPYLFNYLCEYWSTKMDEAMAMVDQSIAKSNKGGLSFLTNYFYRPNLELHDCKNMLQIIKNRLDTLPRALSPEDFYRACSSNLEEQSMGQFEDILPGFWEQFHYSFSSFDARFSLCQKEILDKDFHQAVLHVSVVGVDPGWKDFVALFVGLKEKPDDISHLRGMVEQIAAKNLSSFRQI